MHSELQSTIEKVETKGVDMRRFKIDGANDGWGWDGYRGDLTRACHCWSGVFSSVVPSCYMAWHVKGQLSNGSLSF